MVRLRSSRNTQRCCSEWYYRLGEEEKSVKWYYSLLCQNFTLNSRTDCCAPSFSESVPTQYNLTNTDMMNIFFLSSKNVHELLHSKGKLEELTRLLKTHLKSSLNSNSPYLVPQELITPNYLSFTVFNITASAVSNAPFQMNSPLTFLMTSEIKCIMVEAAYRC